MFGQSSRSDLDFWKFVKENEVIDEESLSILVDNLNDDIMEDKRDDFNDCTDIIDKDAIQFVQLLSDNVAASALVDSSSPHSSPIKLQQTKHDLSRKVVVDNYMNVANKKQ